MGLTSAQQCFVTNAEIVFLVRGYVTGSTDTSLWTVYQRGIRNYCGNLLADGEVHNSWNSLIPYYILLLTVHHLCMIGMVKNQKLLANIITPTTKAADHDVPISPEEVCIFVIFSSFRIT